MDIMYYQAQRVAIYLEDHDNIALSCFSPFEFLIQRPCI